MKCKKGTRRPHLQSLVVDWCGVDTVMSQGGCFLSLIVFVVLSLKKRGLWTLDLNEIQNGRSPGSLDVASQ